MGGREEGDVKAKLLTLRWITLVSSVSNIKKGEGGRKVKFWIFRISLKKAASIGLRGWNFSNQNRCVAVGAFLGWNYWVGGIVGSLARDDCGHMWRRRRWLKRKRANFADFWIFHIAFALRRSVRHKILIAHPLNINVLKFAPCHKMLEILCKYLMTNWDCKVQKSCRAVSCYFFQKPSYNNSNAVFISSSQKRKCRNRPLLPLWF